MRWQLVQRGAAMAPMLSLTLCERHGEPQIATGFDFCVSQRLHFTSGAPGCCAKTRVATFPAEPSAKFLPLWRHSELRSE